MLGWEGGGCLSDEVGGTIMAVTVERERESGRWCGSMGGSVERRCRWKCRLRECD